MLFRGLGILLIFAGLCIGKAHANELLDRAKFADAIAARDKGDYETAFRLFQPLAFRSIPEAQVELANLYMLGHGVAKSEENAITWYQHAEKSYLSTSLFKQKANYMIAMITLSRKSEASGGYRSDKLRSAESRLQLEKLHSAESRLRIAEQGPDEDLRRKARETRLLIEPQLTELRNQQRSEQQARSERDRMQAMSALGIIAALMAAGALGAEIARAESGDVNQESSDPRLVDCFLFSADQIRAVGIAGGECK